MSDVSSASRESRRTDCPWNLKDVALVVIYAVVLFAVFSFWLVSFIVLGDVFLRHFGFSRHFLWRAFKESGYLWVTPLFYAALYAAMSERVFRRYRVSPISFFFSSARLRRDIVDGISAYVRFFAVLLFLSLGLYFVCSVLDNLSGGRTLQGLEVFFAGSRIEQVHSVQETKDLAGFAFLLVFGPFFEELFFRGCLYRALRVRMSLPWAAGISALFFAVLHGYIFLFVYVFVVGIILAVLAAAFGIGAALADYFTHRRD